MLSFLDPSTTIISENYPYAYGWVIYDTVIAFYDVLKISLPYKEL